MINRTENFEEYFYPMLVSSYSGIQDPDEAILRRWDIFDALLEQSRDILVSQETAGVIKYISSQHQFSQDKIEEIARLVRSLFFGEISQEDLANEIQKRIPVVGSNNAQSIARIITDRIINAIPKGGIDSSVDLVKLTLSQALQKYPSLGEQLITGNPIRLKILPTPVRPSVRNWIADYHQVLGAGAHGTMERGNFLYHSENAKRLTARERQKLAVVLKSLDEDETVSIDIDKQKIMFSLQPTTDNLQQTTPDKIPNSNDQKPSWPASISWKRGEQPRPATSDQQPGVKFSYPQRLQSERPQRETYQHYDPYQIIPTGYPEDKPRSEPPKPPPPRQTPPLPPRSEPRISGNVVDLRN